jgi:hypothetical protein
MDFLRRQNAAKYTKAVKKISLDTEGNKKASMGMFENGENGTKGPAAYHFGDDGMVK